MRYSNSAGAFDKSVLFGQQAGDKPVVARWGNWNWDMPGIVRGNQWLYPSPTGGSAVSLGGYGNPGDRPFASDHQVPRRIVVRPDGAVWRWFEGGCCLGHGTLNWMYYGNTSHIPVYGDWNGDGVETPGVYIPALGQWHLNNHWTDNIADIAFAYGGPHTAIPVTGDWNGDDIDTIGLVIPD